MANIIAGRKATGKFFYQYGFGEKLSSVPQKRLTEIICGLAMKGNQSRATDFAELNQGYRTTYGHFLSKGKWDEQKVSQQQQAQALRKADELAGAKCAPIYLSIDDTVIEKKKPSSRATRPPGPWKERVGTIPIWRGNRYTVIRYLVPISAREIFPCAIACAAAVQKTVPRSTWRSNFWIRCLRQMPTSSSKWIAGIPAKPCGTRRWKRILR